MLLINDLCNLVSTYLTEEEKELIRKAYLFGANAHEGQIRKSGEPYITHPIAVSYILAEMHMDAQTLVAAMLHDVIEDTHVIKEKIIEEFGEEVADIVDGLTKLNHITFSSKNEAKAESFRKLILAMVKDLRVIIIKLADRLHNMRTLGVMSAEKSRRIANETLEIYAPIANRLGMNRLRHELEELGFLSCHPMRYRILKETVEKARGNRKEIVHKISQTIRERFYQEQLDCKVEGREKFLYSIYKKMRTKHRPFYEVFDVYAFRITVETVDECYRSLGIIHNIYKPVPGKFKDYIAIPKINGYQSLHSILFSPFGIPIEVQIRTFDMHSVADEGIASHWRYKADKSEKKSHEVSQSKMREWLKSLLEMQQNAGNSVEFLENVKIDLFPDEVYIFTPKGKIMELPRGATAVDFAYAVHTDVGNTCTGVKIDQHMMPLNTVLHNGQTVEIITSASSTTNPAWLNFVFTAKARSNIRHVLKQMQKDESIVLGERLLNKSLNKVNLSLYDIKSSLLNNLLQEYHLENMDDLYFDIGMGNRLPQLVARHLMPQELIESEDSKVHKDKPFLAIKGTEGAVVSYAKCCHPIPGDQIIAYMSKGRGLVIHTSNCRHSKAAAKNPEKYVDLEWSEDVTGDFYVALRVLAVHKKGVLAIVASIIAESEANINNVTTTERDENYSYIDFVLSVKNRVHLARLIRNLRQEEIVRKIIRL